MNEHGSATGLLLLLMPVFVTAAAVAFSGAMTIKVTEQSNLVCRSGVLDAEAHAIANLKRLMSLNPTAKILRTADKASKLTMAIPFYGPISEVGVEEAKIIFHSVQRGIIEKANLEMRADLIKIKYKLNAVMNFGEKDFIRAEITNSPDLAVDAAPPGSLTPDYKPKKEFR